MLASWGGCPESACVAAGDGESCETAMPIEQGSTAGTLDDNTPSEDIDCCCGDGQIDEWYCFMAPSAGAVFVSRVCESAGGCLGGALGVSRRCRSWSGCTDDCTGSVELVLSTETAQATLIRVSAAPDSAGPFELNVTHIAAPAVCTPDAGDCCSPHPEPGCHRPGCCAMICPADPFCCDFSWDATCVNQALQEDLCCFR
jgi:hypothetical protein